MSKYIIVTGGSRGIGKAIVSKLLKEKFSIIYTYQNSNQFANELQDLASENKVECMSYQLDHSDSKQVNEFFDWVIERSDYIVGIINNAGISRSNLVISMTDEEWSKVLDVNLSGPFYMVRSFAKQLIKQREGFIINIASTVGIDGGVGVGNYAASKGGLIAFSKSVGAELSRFGIRNYIIAPGYVDTDMLEDIGESKVKSLKKSIALGRLGTPEEISELIKFLVNGNHYIQNTVIRIDGGLTN